MTARALLPFVLLAPCMPCLPVAPFAAPAAAQQDPQPRLRGVVRDPSTGSVTDVALLFLAYPTPDLPALLGELPPAAPAHATSGAKGTFAIDAAGPGALVATTDKGLGAVVTGVPGRIVVAILQPMAAVTLPGASDAFTLWPAWIDPATGRRHHLPPQEGVEARLPQGTYEAWFRVGDAYCWQRLELRSGETRRLDAGTQRLRLARRGEHTVHPAAFPQVELLGRDATHCELLGDAVYATLWAEPFDGGRALPPGTPPARAPAPVPWPPVPVAQREVVLHCDGVGDGQRARAFLLERTNQGGWRVLARGGTDAAGTVRLPVPELPGEHELLVTAPQRAPWSMPLPTGEAGGAEFEAHLLPGRDVRCDVLDDEGMPVAGAAVEFEPAAGAAATSRAYTDELGRVLLRHVLGDGRLRVVDERYLGEEDELLAPAAERRIVLTRGATLHGRAVVHGEAPAAGIAVTLRDPTGRLRPLERVALTEPDGTFTFPGLPPDREFVLFAQRIQGGLTWSAKTRTLPTDTPTLDLLFEDPKLK